MVLIMNIDKDFQNIVSKVLQMAQKVAQKNGTNVQKLKLH